MKKWTYFKTLQRTSIPLRCWTCKWKLLESHKTDFIAPFYNIYSKNIIIVTYL
jgi:hypothetical protein